MKLKFEEIEPLLIEYFSDKISEKEKKTVDDWRKSDPENEKLFKELLFSWNAMPELKNMELFNSFEALRKIEPSLEDSVKYKWIGVFQRIAAILIIPLMFYALYISVQNASTKKLTYQDQVIQTVKSKEGIVSKIILSDRTKVWLNSDATIQFPVNFIGEKREITLNGEAYFEVTENKEKPFIINSNGLKIEVLGTSFNVSSYLNETNSEVVLVNGKVNLYAMNKGQTTSLGYLTPGYKAVFDKGSGKAVASQVEVDKYVSWINGQLIFRDDSMSEVVKRLSHWYNVEITILDKEINDYIYTATFSNETISQVLYLLSISAPIDYKIKGREKKGNGEFTKQKIILMKKKKQ
jgi:ferric-dicitrate binding protein FerR (iron transport regulator)